MFDLNDYRVTEQYRKERLQEAEEIRRANRIIRERRNKQKKQSTL